MRARELIRLLTEECDRRDRNGLDGNPPVELAVSRVGGMTAVGDLRWFSLVGSQLRLTSGPYEPPKTDASTPPVQAR
jgi:hypothetical protein